MERSALSMSSFNNKKKGAPPFIVLTRFCELKLLSPFSLCRMFIKLVSIPSKNPFKTNFSKKGQLNNNNPLPSLNCLKLVYYLKVRIYSFAKTFFMAKFKSEDLLNDLAQDVKRVKESAEFFSAVDKNKLVYCPDKGRWSVVQVLEHLNAYNRHYLPAIEKELSVVTYDANSWFTSGYWGEKFTKMMKPANVFEIKNKMKTAKKMSFPNSLNIDTVTKEFLEGQDKLLRLLEMAKGKDLAKIHIPITLTKLIKLRLGDTLRFVIAHEQRHMIQARNTIKETGVATDQFPAIINFVAASK